MIDIENYVYTQVRGAVLSAYPKTDVSSEYVENPASFPHVCFELTDDTVVSEYLTAQEREFASAQTFTANIYTNTPTAKSDAKKLAEIVDLTMQRLGFRRSMYMRTPNIDRTIYRLTMRYEGIVSKAYDQANKHFNITAG